MANPPAKPTLPNWTIVSQQEGTKIDVTGNPVQGVTVTFRLDDGTIGSVFVADASYTVDNVRDAIGRRAVIIDQVGNLSSGS